VFGFCMCGHFLYPSRTAAVLHYSK